MFRGIAQLMMDSKGRLMVPARHRDELLARCGGHVVITADAARCLLIYPLQEWESIQQKLLALSNLDPLVRKMQRRLIGQAVDTDMDAAGRLLVPQALRDYAQLSRDVALVGQTNKFELWNAEQWKSELDAPDDVPPQLEGFSL